MMTKTQMELVLSFFVALMVGGILVINFFQFELDKEKLKNEVNFVNSVSDHLIELDKYYSNN